MAGWHRFVPLALGVYVIVPMTPALLASHSLGRFAIGGWMLGFTALGWVLVAAARDRDTVPVSMRTAGDPR